MKLWSVGLALLGLCISLEGGASADEKKAAEPKPLVEQTTCPVMGGKINKKLYVDVKGKRIYMCCPGCKAPITQNPDKYLKMLKDAGQKPACVACTVGKVKPCKFCAAAQNGESAKAKDRGKAVVKKKVGCCGGCR